jgi:hypothetical protein
MKGHDEEKESTHPRTICGEDPGRGHGPDVCLLAVELVLVRWNGCEMSLKIILEEIILDRSGGLSCLVFLIIIVVGYFSFTRSGTYRIDSSVKNKIIAHDNQGRYLVEAKTSRQIIGPRPHVTGNLPASIQSVGKGKWVVDRNGFLQPEEIEKIKWIPLEGYSIQPRGNTKTGGFLADEVEGWEHNYIKEDED